MSPQGLFVLLIAPPCCESEVLCHMFWIGIGNDSGSKWHSFIEMMSSSHWIKFLYYWLWKPIPLSKFLSWKVGEYKAITFSMWIIQRVLSVSMRTSRLSHNATFHREMTKKTHALPIAPRPLHFIIAYAYIHINVNIWLYSINCICRICMYIYIYIYMNMSLYLCKYYRCSETLQN